jgi:putative addiction module component (TIGR02574 family)
MHGPGRPTVPPTLTEIAELALSLPAEDRAKLADILLESLPDAPLPEIEAAWKDEIERRVASHNRGESTTYAAEDVLAEVRRLTQ